METLRQKQKEEAINRMKLLELDYGVIKDFVKTDRVYYSERQNSVFNAILYWLDNNPKWLELVKEFEEEHNFLVYHAQLTHTYDGDLLSLLYVSDSENEWTRDQNDICNGEAFVKVVNLDSEIDSDYGYIGIKPSMGGVLRTW